MAWESVTAKDAQGISVSIEGLVSDVYLADGRAVSEALASIASQAAILNTNITNMTAAVNAAVAAAS